jgi:DNA polymerase-4
MDNLAIDSSRPQTGILCADVDAMFATIEAIERGLGPDVPILVGGAPEERGVVSTASYAARLFGCHSAMPMAQALRLCPQAIRIPPRHDLYEEYSGRIMEILRTYGPLEQMSIDEAYVDAGPAGIDRELGLVVKAAIRKSTRLTISVGLSSNKLVSKIASGFEKPDGLTVVPAGGESAFLAPLDIGRLHGVGPKTRARLAELGVQTCHDLTRLPLESLIATFGSSAGQSLYEHARGIDDSPLVTQRDLKQISQETTYVHDVLDRAKLWATLREQCDAVASRLQTHRVLARTVSVKLRYADFQLVSRSTSLPVPSDDPSDLAQAAARLMRSHWDRQRAVRLIGVAASRLVPGESWLQLALPLAVAGDNRSQSNPR